MQAARILEAAKGLVLRKYSQDCNLSRQTCPPFIYCNSPDEIHCQMIYFLDWQSVTWVQRKMMLLNGFIKENIPQPCAQNFELKFGCGAIYFNGQVLFIPQERCEL